MSEINTNQSPSAPEGHLDSDGFPQNTGDRPRPFYSRWLVVTLLFVIVLGLGAWWFLSSKSGSTILPPVIVDTAESDWQTYHNQEYGFEFKYPRNWHLATNEVSPGSLFLSPEEINFPSVWGGQLTPLEAYTISSQQYENSLKFWKDSKTDYENFQEESILSSEGKRFQGVSRSSYDEYSYGLFVSEAYLNLNGSNFLALRYKSDSDKPNDGYAVYNQILGTFRFIDKNILPKQLTIEQLNRIRYEPFHNPPLQNGTYIVPTLNDCTGVHGTCPSGYLFYYFDQNKIVRGDLNNDGLEDVALAFYSGWLCGDTKEGNESSCNPDDRELARQIQARERGETSVDSSEIFAVLNNNGNPGGVFRFHTFDEIRIPGGIVTISPLQIAKTKIEAKMIVTIRSLVQQSTIQLSIDQSRGKLREVRNGHFGPSEWGTVVVPPKIDTVSPLATSLGSKFIIKGENFRFYQNKIRLTPESQDLLPRSSCLEIVLPSVDDGRTIVVELANGLFNTPLECRKDNPLRPAESDLRQIVFGQYYVSVILDSDYPKQVESEKVLISVL